MKKAIFHSAFSLILFFSLWWMLSQINFVEHNTIKKVNELNDSIIGDVFIKEFEITTNKIENDSIQIILKKIKDRICTKNNISSSDINVQLYNNIQINALAFPGKNIIVLSGLVEFCNTKEELSAVLAHEIAHIELEHIKKKLIKEVGISMLLVISGNNASQEIIREIVRKISSSSFDREMEREADEKAVEYLSNANIHPKHLANFLYRLSENQPGIMNKLEWINSHPNSDERAADILQTVNDKEYTLEEIITDKEWEYLRNNLNYY